MRADKYKAKIFGYIKSKMHTSEVADLLSDNNFNEYAYFYNCYPYLFAEAFGNFNEEKLELLNIAGFLCYKAIVLRDDFIDKNSPDIIDIKKNEISRIFLDNATNLLLGIFGKESNFWMYWKKRKSELNSTEEFDKMFIKENIDFEQYATFADNKSAFAKLAIDGLYVLSNEANTEGHEALINSHREFSIAMQIFDDLFDVEEDFENKQFNLAINNVRNIIQKETCCEVLKDSNVIEKHLFLSGIANDMLQKALLHLDFSEYYAKPYKVNKWKGVINFYRKIFKAIINQKEAYLEIVKAKVRHSRDKVNIFVDENNLSPLIQKGIQNGIEFIVSKQRTDGTWFEYLTSAGASDIWATGFIAFFCNNIIPKENIQKATNALLSDAHPLWGYKQSYLNDTDSSNFALLALESVSKNKIERLIQRQNFDGGFPTYIDREVKELRKYMKYPKESKYAGWTQSHLCVSAVTYYFLVSNKNHFNDDCIQKLEIFLFENLSSKKQISYWWGNEIYTLYWLSLSFQKISKPELKNIVKDRLLDSVNNYRPLLNPDNNNKISVFFTALQLNIFIVLHTLHIKNCQSLIIYLVGELLKEQYIDGSWKETNAMRLPDTEILNPCETEAWPASGRGCNVRAIEFNRLFTTSVTINALNNLKILNLN